MEKKWTDNPQQIVNALSSLSERHISVTLLINGNMPHKAKILKIHDHKGKKYLILNRPRNLWSSRDINSIVYQLKSLPVLCFPCRIVNDTPKHIAIMLPEEIFLMQRREHLRFLAPKDAMATFLIPRKQRTNICLIKDISMGGAKLLGAPQYKLKENDLIGPTTFLLTGQSATISRQITLQKARVMRSCPLQNDKVELGILFYLADNERRELEEHLTYLTQQAPTPLKKAPYV